jgi:hypothetical protein
LTIIGSAESLEVIPEYKIDLARELRQRQTASEAGLWQHLRGRRLAGFKFRRQHPIGRYVADVEADIRTILNHIRQAAAQAVNASATGTPLPGPGRGEGGEGRR